MITDLFFFFVKFQFFENCLDGLGFWILRENDELWALGEKKKRNFGLIPSPTSLVTANVDLLCRGLKSIVTCKLSGWFSLRFPVNVWPCTKYLRSEPWKKHSQGLVCRILDWDWEVSRAQAVMYRVWIWTWPNLERARRQDIRNGFGSMDARDSMWVSVASSLWYRLLWLLCAAMFVESYTQHSLHLNPPPHGENRIQVCSVVSVMPLLTCYCFFLFCPMSLFFTHCFWVGIFLSFDTFIILSTMVCHIW